MSLDGFSMHPLAVELHAQLAGGRIDRIFQPNKHTILLSIRQPGKNLTLHISINPQNPVINIITRAIGNPPIPPLFCMVLRKQIEDGRIAAVEQCGLDRIISLHIDVLGVGGVIVTKMLTVELMGKHSNMILLQDNRIIDAIRKVGSNENRVRQILPGRDYVPPPNQNKLNLLTAPAAEWITALKACPDIPLVKAIVRTALGLGPVSAKEFICRAGLPADLPVEAMADCDFASLAAAVQEVTADFAAQSIAPTIVIGENKKLLAIAAFRLDHLSADTAQSFSTISEALDYSTAIAGSYTPPDKDKFKKLVGNELTKAKNKLTALHEDLEQAHNAEDYKVKADILMTYQYELPQGYVKQVELPDIYNTAPTEAKICIDLDPLLSPMQNMQKYYQKYNKLKRAQELLQVQIKQCRDDIRYLSSIESSLESSVTLPEISEIKAELIAAGYLNEKIKRKAPSQPSQPLKFSIDNTTILVGRNNDQNDRLTFKIAQPSDIWLHVKDIPGSHVIIRAENRDTAEEVLEYAAQIAGYFSKAKDSSNIPVDYAKRQYVKKPAGAKPGFVIYTNQKTLYVTPDHEKIEADLLLAKE